MKKKPYDEGYFFEIQSLEEMHAFNTYLPRGGTETNRERFADICNSRQSEIGIELWTYCRFDTFIPYT